MASCKFIRRPLLRHARGLCNKQDVHHCRPRPPLQLLAALEEYVVARPGKVVLNQLKMVVFHEKQMIEVENRHLREKVGDLTQRIEDLQRLVVSARELRTFDQVLLLESKGLNNTCGLFEMLQEVLATKAGVTTDKGSTLWETILGANWRLRACIEHCTNIPTEEVAKQAAQCYAIYSVLSHHIKVLASLRTVKGKIIFQRGPLSPEQVQIFLCIGQEAGFTCVEHPYFRPC